MTDQHAEGTASTARGKVEEAVGTATGTEGQELCRRGRKVHGSGRQGLDALRDAILKPEDRT